MSKSKKKIPKHEMSAQDVEELDELYDYVRYNVLGYDKNQSLPRNYVLRLIGLRRGIYMADNESEDKSDYSYKIILLTFKYCMSDIRRGFASNSFKDESHKFNYAMKIVENNLNTVYKKMKSIKRAKDKIEKSDLSDSYKYVNNFKPKNNDLKKSKIGNKLKELW